MQSLQALPRNARPVLDYPNRDDAFTEIAEGIAKLVNSLLAGRQPATAGST